MVRGASNDGDFSFVVEELRLAGYAGFWFIVLTGVVLTRVYGGIDMDQTILTQVFGYNNICVYFDFAPATYVLPFLWAITLAILLCYLGAQWLQMRAEAEQGALSPGLFRLLTKAKVFEATMLIAFSTIFAVQPEAWDHTLFIHTVPFFLLQIGLVSLAISNTVHGIKSGYWSSLALPSWFIPAAKVYVVVFAIIVCFKIPLALNAMSGGMGWENTLAVARFARVVDVLFLLFAAIIPMWKAAYFVWGRRDRLKVVRLRLRTA
jgi:hypothetical protein